jgi:malonyl-CoA O-methyltransferase
MHATGDSGRLDEALVLRRFDRAAATFDDTDFMCARTRDGLLARLAPMTVTATSVLDLGCATGVARSALEKRFRGALVTGCDLSAAMLATARQRRSWFSRPALVRADARQLPFTARSIDVVFANMLLPWIDEPAGLFEEVARVLRKDGVFLFATLGPDSLRQLRAAWRRVDTCPHVHDFADMHDVGDALVRAGLREPVLDVDRLTLTYASPGALFDDLRKAGAANSLEARRRSLLGKGRFASLIAALEAERVGGRIPVDLEIVYGHCWGPVTQGGGVEVAIDAGRIGLRRHHRN